MKFVIFFTALLLGSNINYAQQERFQEILNAGIAAYEQNEFQNALQQFSAAGILRGISPAQKRKVIEWSDKARSGKRDADFFVLLSKGIAALDKEDYPTAIIEFENAKKLPGISLKQQNTLVEYIDDSKSRYINGITEAKEEAEYQQRIAQARFNALKANQAIEKGQPKEALDYAFTALKLSEEDAEIEVKRAFGDAIYLNNAIKLTGHEASLKKIDFSNNGQNLISLGRDGKVKIWDTRGKNLSTIEANKDLVQLASFTSVSPYKVVTVSNKNLEVWDIDGQKLKDLGGHLEDINALEFSPDGSDFLTSSRDKTAKLWSLDGRLNTTLQGHSGFIMSTQYSSDSKFILSRSSDNTIKLWSSQGDLLADLIGHTAYIYSAIFSDDGSKILSASGDKTAKLWNAKGNIIADLEGHTGLVISALFAPHGQSILTASTDGLAKLWDYNGQLLHTLEGHKDWITKIEFSPDGEDILTLSKDKTVKIWDTKTGELKTTLQQSDEIRSANFSPKQRKHIITGSIDGTAKLWDLEGNILMNLNGFQGPINTVQFSPDGDAVLVGSEDGTAVYCIVPEVGFSQMISKETNSTIRN